MTELIAYASRTGTRRNLAKLREAGWRLFVSATGVHRTEGFRYAVDNGAWTAHQQGKPFDEAAFAKVLSSLGAGADFVVLPDIVCGGWASLDLSFSWLGRVHDRTELALLPVQNGVVPSDVEAWVGPRLGLFVGGDTEWKLRTVAQWAEVGRRRRCWVHVGRVNSQSRILTCSRVGATSFDGSSASRFSVTLPPLDAARRQRKLFA